MIHFKDTNCVKDLSQLTLDEAIQRQMGDLSQHACFLQIKSRQLDGLCKSASFRMIEFKDTNCMSDLSQLTLDEAIHRLLWVM